MGTQSEVPRFLLIDSYDSFTHNLAALCRRAIPGCIVHIIRNDDIPLDQLTPLLRHFSAVIVGPGPGSPGHDADVGVLRDIWKMAGDDLIPIFGVCLGLQSMALAFGATIHRLNVVKHGQISRIYHDDNELYEGVGDVHAVRYHSLHVMLDGSKDLECLASADDGKENGLVVMALKHNIRPFWAVQYHPESVRTSGGGEDVLRNFWRLAQNWTASRHRQVRPWDADVEVTIGKPWPNLQRLSHTSITPHLTVATHVLEHIKLTIPDICEAIGVASEDSDFVLLDSVAQPGRFSIIGCLDQSSTRIAYQLDEHDVVKVTRHGRTTAEQFGSQDIWTWLADFMRPRRAAGGEESIPFWGGLVGYMSYEVGVANLGAVTPHRTPPLASPKHSDINLVYVDRSIVMDAMTGKVYLQTLREHDHSWLEALAVLLEFRSFSPGSQRSHAPRAKPASQMKVSVLLPDKDTYTSRIRRAQEYLFAGDSYELCLTAPSRISVNNSSGNGRLSSWDLYKTLRRRNPAPHAAYLRLNSSILVSSSPERFLSYSRPHGTVCQLRPIKGTVRKGPSVTRAVAEEALVGSPKEVAENLMIVDLIRHDLHGVVGDNVVVKQFCGIEEYETVWQLVSVIEGQAASENDHYEMGWEVLRRSLPPGSMTGAPKKRSVEILHTLEDEPRGIYSGVFGYWDVGGGGDWAVTIRTCFKYDARDQRQDSHQSGPDLHDEWMLGAGGAITALSDPEAEWEEMMVKVESVLQAFQDVRT
ncbi:unnamed protein product [Somion occarium]